MKKLSKNAIIGYPAGIITGITYGLNPLFAVPLMKNGAATESILFFRYAFAVLLLGLFLMLRKQSFRISGKQIGVLLALGVLYTSSSVFLFEAYEYIASGLATTLVFLYPVLVAIIMVFLKVVPSWPVWLAIAATFGGVLVMTQSDGTQTINPVGVLLSIARHWYTHSSLSSSTVAKPLPASPIHCLPSMRLRWEQSCFSEKSSVPTPP